MKGFTGKMEMGQGINTSLSQILADELDVPYESVKMVMSDTELCPWDGGTNGSRTTRGFGPPFRAAAAEARAILLQMASEQLGVPVSGLEIKNGIISDKSNSAKKLSYAQLTRGKKIERHLENKPAPKDYILATNENHSVREFIEHSFALVGMSLKWKGSGVEETGIDANTGKVLVKINPKFFRPGEVDQLLGDYSMAKKELGWSPEVKFKDLVEIMVKRDLERIKSGR